MLLKRIVTTVVTGALILAFSAPVLANPDKKGSKKHITENARVVEKKAPASSRTGAKLIIHGQDRDFETPPLVISGRTMIPLREVAELLGADVDWDNLTKTVNVKDKNFKGKGLPFQRGKGLKKGHVTLVVNGQEILSDVPPGLIKSKVMVPLRAIAEALGIEISWDKETRTITINNSQIIGVANKLAINSVDAAQTVGNDLTVQVNVQDSTTPGNTLANDNGRTVTLTVKNEEGAVVGTFSGATENGVASIKVNLTKSGTYTGEATSTGLTKVSTTTGAIVFKPGAATVLTLESDLTTLAADGLSTAALTVGQVDQYGNVVAGNPAAALAADSSSYGTLAGTTFTAGTVNGATIITASLTGMTSAAVTINTVVVGAAVKQAIETITDTEADGSSTQTVNVTIQDADGNRVTSSNANVTLTANGTTADLDRVAAGVQLTNTVAAVKGQATFTATNTKAEEVTYSATSGTLTPATATGKFVPGAAAKILVSLSPSSIAGNGSSLSTATVKVTDANGNSISGVSGTVTLKITAGSDYALLIGAAADGTLEVSLNDGAALATIQAKDITLAGVGQTSTVTATYKPDASTTWTGTADLTVSLP